MRYEIRWEDGERESGHQDGGYGVKLLRDGSTGGMCESSEGVGI